jgi:hypothetical protein
LSPYIRVNGMHLEKVTAGKNLSRVLYSGSSAYKILHPKVRFRAKGV